MHSVPQKLELRVCVITDRSRGTAREIQVVVGGTDLLRELPRSIFLQGVGAKPLKSDRNNSLTALATKRQMTHTQDHKIKIKIPKKNRRKHFQGVNTGNKWKINQNAKKLNIGQKTTITKIALLKISPAVLHIYILFCFVMHTSLPCRTEPETKRDKKSGSLSVARNRVRQQDVLWLPWATCVRCWWWAASLFLVVVEADFF